MLMTREQWEESTQPQTMLAALSQVGYADESKLREFACWCVRQVWDLLPDPRSRDAVEVAERFAGGEATAEELAAARNEAYNAIRGCSENADRAPGGRKWRPAQAPVAAAQAAQAVTEPGRDGFDAAECAAGYAADAAGWRVETDANGSGLPKADAARAEAAAAQADELRELIPWEVVEPLFAAALTTAGR